MKQTSKHIFMYIFADTFMENKLFKLNFHNTDWESLPYKYTLKWYKLNHKTAQFSQSTKRTRNYFNSTESTSAYLAFLLKKGTQMLILRLGFFSE